MAGTYPVVFTVTGGISGKMRNELSARMDRPDDDNVWHIATDEGDFHGGEGTATPQRG